MFTLVSERVLLAEAGLLVDGAAVPEEADIAGIYGL